MATETPTVSGEDGFREQYGRAVAVIFVGLIITHLPIISLITIIPFFKEVVFGALAVALLTNITDGGTGAKYALLSGMAAAVVFNMIWIPFNFIAPSLFGFATGGVEGASAGLAGGLFRGLGAASNLIGLIVLSPIGYSVGGLIGSFFN